MIGKGGRRRRLRVTGAIIQAGLVSGRVVGEDRRGWSGLWRDAWGSGECGRFGVWGL